MKRRGFTRRNTTVLVPIVVLAASIVIQTVPAAADPVSVDNHWELTNEAASYTSNKTIPLSRGSLPGGTSKFDPQPTAELAVSALHAGGTGTSKWDVALKSGSSTLATVSFPATTNTNHLLKTAAIAWPSTGKALTSITLAKTHGTGTAGTLTLNKATIAIRQTGVITKTVMRAAIATKQVNITNNEWQDVADPIYYTHVAGDFDPAPTISLRTSGVEITSNPILQSLHVRLVDDAGTVKAQNLHTSFASVSSDAFTLEDGGRYHLQVKVTQLLQSGELHSADLVFEQTTSDPAGLIKLVGWYAGVTGATSMSTDGAFLGFGFIPPQLQVPYKSASWLTGIKKTTPASVGNVAADLRSTDGNTVIATGSGTASTTDYAYLQTDGVALPSSGADTTVTWDTRTVLCTGCEGRIAYSALRVVITLIPVPPMRLSFQAHPNPFSPSASAPRNQTSIRATLLDPLPWSVTIADQGGQTLRSFSGQGRQVTAVWDGKDSSGATVPDGPYRVTLHADDAEGNQLSDSLWVTVGPAPLISSISPTGPFQVGARLSITGANFGSGVGSYGVTINGRSAFIAAWGSTEITADIPPGIQPGEAEVSVYAADIASIAASVEIAKYSYPPTGVPVVPGSVWVRLTEGADPDVVAVRNGSAASDIEQQVPGIQDSTLARWYHVAVPAGQERTKAEAYAADADVEVAEVRPLDEFVLNRNVDDDEFAQQWGLEQSTNIDIDAKRAWDVSIGGTSIVIGVVDSGIGPHDDIVTNRVAGKNYINPAGSDSDGCVSGFSHGTFVAGVASADTDNSKGIAGVGWRTKVRPYRVGEWAIDPNTGVFDCRYRLDGLPGRSLMDVMKDVVANGDKVVNMSFGSSTHVYADQDAMTYAWNSGVVLVAAAGNRGLTSDATTPQYPAAYDNVLAVGAHNKDGTRSDFSSRGDWVDLYAPGRAIRSTLKTADSVYATAEGTSFAAPMVAGTAGLLMDRGINNTMAVNAITETVKGTLERLNAGDALEFAADLTLPNGTWLKDQRDNQPQVYFLDSGKRRPVTASSMSSWGVALSDVVRVPKGHLDSYPIWESSSGAVEYIGFRPGSLIAPVPSTSDQLNPPPEAGIFVVSNDRASGASQRSKWLRGYKYRLLPPVFACLAYVPVRVRQVSVFEATRHSTAPAPNSDWTDCTKHPNGTVVREASDLEPQLAWMRQDGDNRKMRDVSVIASWGAGPDAVVAAASELSGTAGAEMGYRPGVVLRVTGPSERWAVTADGSDWPRGTKRKFSPLSAYSCYGYTREVRPENRNYVSQLHPTDGASLTC